ncbi:uncharacterized protein LAESUDRAFT_295798 [Laetiporus sulphureus 93-53]|uniref:Uncharacterized protein n=1 Tax=Laetiporus sulphureus 93-53 TaxID=1314785 RepID=A0A165DB77_9APHY|nr:uncharacterized protein LAESUDRAFT_295798 [Laetiporus sulphureus 93-53]KZT04472.1 hypothetical protein LAESUDRAFT_295798 [Laetiporus sulphureus 93-53]
MENLSQSTSGELRATSGHCQNLQLVSSRREIASWCHLQTHNSSAMSSPHHCDPQFRDRKVISACWGNQLQRLRLLLSAKDSTARSPTRMLPGATLLSWNATSVYEAYDVVLRSGNRGVQSRIGVSLLLENSASTIYCRIILAPFVMEVI